MLRSAADDEKQDLVLLLFLLFLSCFCERLSLVRQVLFCCGTERLL